MHIFFGLVISENIACTKAKVDSIICKELQLLFTVTVYLKYYPAPAFVFVTKGHGIITDKKEAVLVYTVGIEINVYFIMVLKFGGCLQ